MKRILLYRLGSLGDTCIALPAFRLVRTKFPDAGITLLTNLPVNAKAAPAPALLDGLGIIDDYLAYTVGTRNVWQIGSLALKLRRRRFDAAINLAEWRGERVLRRDELFFRAAGVKQLIGFDPAAGHELRTEADGTTEREATRLLRRIAALGEVDANDPRWYGLELSEAEIRGGERRLREAGIGGSYLVFSVGTKVAVNDWGQANWRALLANLAPTCRIFGGVFLGASDERSRADECLRAWDGPRLNLCGQTSVRESAAVLAGAELFVGHDSGPMHLAATVGTRCVAVFSARNPPGKWFPLGDGHRIFYRRVECAGCGLTECEAEGMRCIRGVAVGEVATAVREQVVEMARPIS